MAFVNYNAWAEVVCTPVDFVYKMPDEMTFSEAAAFSLNFVAAYMMLFEVANLKEGMSVLVHSAGGGVVSTFSIWLAQPWNTLSCFVHLGSGGWLAPGVCMSCLNSDLYVKVKKNKTKQTELWIILCLFTFKCKFWNEWRNASYLKNKTVKIAVISKDTTCAWYK